MKTNVSLIILLKCLFTFTIDYFASLQNADPEALPFSVLFYTTKMLEQRNI